MSLLPKPDFGTDLAALPDLEPRLPLQSGLRNLGEAIARRLQTPRGSLFYAPNYGTDIRAWLNEAMTTDDLFRAKVAVEAECEKDERVLSADAEVVLNRTLQTLTLRLTLTTAAGPFRLVLSVDQVTVTLIEVA